METRVELMLLLLSERHSLINCATEAIIFLSVCMVIFFEGKGKGIRLEKHCRSKKVFNSGRKNRKH